MLLVDTSNAYKRVASVSKGDACSFFSYIRKIQNKYSKRKVCFAFDSSCNYKRSLYPAYKHNRNGEKESELDVIQQLIRHIPGYSYIYHPDLEADDVAYQYCCDHNNVLCMSEDRDWLSLLLCNENINIVRKKKVVCKMNFEELFGFPPEKIPLWLFLKGDSKDGVKKPFRVRSHKKAMGFNTIDEYLASEVNPALHPRVQFYRKLIESNTDLNYIEVKGKRTAEGKKVLKHHGIVGL